MLRNKLTTRRRLLSGLCLAGTAGCLGARDNQRGIVDPADFQNVGDSSKLSVRRVEQDGAYGVQFDTHDRIQDDASSVRLPAKILDVSKSRLFIKADIDSIDDDAEFEILFCGSNDCRRIVAGNEFKSGSDGVLGTESGSGFILEQNFSELPLAEGSTNGPTTIESLEFRISEGDFKGVLWVLAFRFEDRTVVLI